MNTFPQHRHLTPLLLTAVLAANLPLGGCIIGSHSDVKTTGSYIGPQSFTQIEPGTTTGEWVLATFGEPTSRSSLSDGTEVWKWTYSRVKTGRGSLLFVYGGSDRTETQGAAFVQLRDGLVINKWRD